MPAPRFAATRETALARCRSSGGASDASSVDWLGISAPFPTPAAEAAIIAWAGVWAKARPA